MSSTQSEAQTGVERHKPSEHGGLTKSGEPDKRMSSEHGFGGNREKASEAGRKGGQTSGTSGAVGGDDGGPDKEQDPAVDETYKPEEDDTV